MTILCELDPTVAEHVAAGVGGAVQLLTSLSAVGVALQTSPDERVVVIGETVDVNHVVSFTQGLARDYPDVGVVVLSRALEPDAAAAMQAAGVRGFARPDDLGGIVDAVHRVATGTGVAPATAPRRRGQIITVYAAKGGTGKTTVATNLAVVLNGDGERSVCLVDLDLEFGDVAVSLQLAPARTLIDAVEMGHVDAMTIGNLLTNYRPNLDCVLAPIEPGDAERIPAQLVTQLLETLVTTHDFVIVDTPSQLSEHVLAAMDISHHFVLLTTPEIPALKNMRLALDMLDLLGYNPNARSIVLNRADARSGLSAAEVEKAIKTPIAAHVPTSHDVPASINRGVPLAASNPKHPVTVVLRTLAEQLFIGTEAPASPRQARRGMRLRMRSS